MRQLDAYSIDSNSELSCLSPDSDTEHTHVDMDDDQHQNKSAGELNHQRAAALRSLPLPSHDSFKLKTITEIFGWEIKCMCGNCAEKRLQKLQMEHRYSNGNIDRNGGSEYSDIYTKIWDFVAVKGEDGIAIVKLLFGIV